MKLNKRRTILVGFAFFLISAFWQGYDTLPITLTNKFGMSQTMSGFIMTLDNILALVLLPLFGAISDRCKAKMGRRKPFVLIGTILAVCTLFTLTLVDNAQLARISEVSTADDPAALTLIYDAKKDTELINPNAKFGESGKYTLSEKYTLEEFTQIKCEISDPETGKMKSNPEYVNFVVPARQSYIHDITSKDPSMMILFVAVLMLVLISMAVFRSPAVALMPDVTIKPLRSKGNAIINLMGTAGGILVLLVGKVIGTGKNYNQLMSYTPYYSVVILIMLVALVIFMLTVKEPKWVAEMQAKTQELGLEDKEEASEPTRKLSGSERWSLILIVLSVFLWYFGYNAVTSKYSVYASNILAMDYNTTLLIAQGAAIVAYLPAGIVASKIGRRKTILAGIIMLATAFGAAYFMHSGSSVWLMNILFATAGIGWATINVNSFPMVVEMCSGSNVGKYTGFYYTGSMAAQALTPTLCGKLMDVTGSMKVLFPYASVFVALAFVTMLFVKHGNAKVEAKKGLEALDIED